MEAKEYKDITLICKETGKEFIWTAGEQKFYDEKGFTNPPKVCPEVRAARKAEKNSGNFDRKSDRNNFDRKSDNNRFAYRTDDN